MRGYENSLLVLVWGLAVGMLLWGSGYDIELQRFLWANYHQGFNDVMRVLGEIGKGTALIGMVVVLGGGRLVWEWRRTGMGWRQGGGALILAVIPVVALAGAANIFLKWVIGRARPKEFLMYGNDPWVMKPLHGEAVYWSFPSGHACSVFAFAVWVGLVFPRWRWAALAAAVVLAGSRFLAITPHYLGDVVAGAGLGAAVALAVWQWSKDRRYV
jgi:membrane-associated phospholipid phosphatase